MAGSDVFKHPIHLGLGAKAQVEPLFDGSPQWYEQYAARHAEDGVEGRLVSMHTFSTPWKVWEMHPVGDEVVLCTSGAMTLLQEMPGGTIKTVKIEAGEYAINEAGVWHTADVSRVTTAMFITAGKGTQHRQRGP